jgi:hypothetical protein
VASDYTTDLIDGAALLLVQAALGVYRTDGTPYTRALMTLADGVRDLFHNRRSFWLGGVYVALCWRQSQAPMGADVHGRQELAANYYLRTTRPSPNLYE